MTLLTEIDFVQRDARRDRRSSHHLCDGRKNALVVLGFVDMVDVEGFGDVTEAHIGRPHIDELPLPLRGYGLGIDVVRDHRACRPDHYDDTRLLQCGPDLVGVGGSALQLTIPPD
jgi:hypothetical protein